MFNQWNCKIGNLLVQFEELISVVILHKHSSLLLTTIFMIYRSLGHSTFSRLTHGRNARSGHYREAGYTKHKHQG